MTGKRPVRKKTSSGRGMFVIVALVLAAGVVKYSDAPFAAAAREKVSDVLVGAPGVDNMLAVFGGAEEPADTGEETYAASSGGAEDVPGREQSLFPDTVDDAVHAMSFDHVLPVEGVLTRRLAAGSARRAASRRSTTALTLQPTRGRRSRPLPTARCARWASPITAII